MGISVVINTYNSEQYLAECLASVQGVEDIVVCDMHSTDATQAIVAEFGARLLLHERTGYVEPARNAAIAGANQDWVLVVDSDEVVPEGLLAYLRALVALDDPPDVVLLPRRNRIFGRFLRGSWYPDYQCRFFRKGSVHWHPGVHSAPTTQGRCFHVPAERTDLALIHYNYDSIESFVSRLNRYTSLELQNYQEQQRTFSLWQLLVKPFTVFFRLYVLKGGFQDGMPGFLAAVLMAVYRWVSLAKLWELTRLQPQTPGRSPSGSGERILSGSGLRDRTLQQ